MMKQLSKVVDAVTPIASLILALYYIFRLILWLFGLSAAICVLVAYLLVGAYTAYELRKASNTEEMTE